jgi:outer membrane protein OmpA-like peptidoglycan-associated protein
MNVNQNRVVLSQQQTSNEGTEWLSISDLMAGLLLIFALLVVVTLYQLKTIQEETQNKRIVVIQALTEQFNSNGINAEINPETGDITLLDSVLFDFNERELKPQGKSFLAQFIPIYSGVIFSEPKISEEVTQVIIEGHTSSDGAVAYNMQLSLGRANSVYQFINTMVLPKHKQDFLAKIQVAGRGSMDADTLITNDADRKVIFRMQFKSDDSFNAVSRLVD